MYCKFFGFSERPFEVTPDPRFFYLTPGNREILAALVYGINEHRGFIVVVGEVGTGKTTLLNTAMEEISSNTDVAFIFNTDLTFKQLLMAALVDLGVAEPELNLNKGEAIHRLNTHAIKQHASGGNVVLMVDEAQDLSLRSLENLRLLSNLETRTHKLVQIVLSGQPELEKKLRKPQLRQLSQRISLKRYLNPLSEHDTYEFIQHRLSTANYTGKELFSNRAQELIWSFSDGIPRKINILCDNTLLIGFGLGKDRITQDIVMEAIKDLAWCPLAIDPGNDDLLSKNNGPGQQALGTFRLR